MRICFHSVGYHLLSSDAILIGLLVQDLWRLAADYYSDSLAPKYPSVESYSLNTSTIFDFTALKNRLSCPL